MQLTKILLLPDLHIPRHDEKSLRAVLKYAKQHGPWDYVIQLGDLMDFSYFSRFSPESIQAVEGQRLALDYEIMFNVLEQIKDACGEPKKRKTEFDGTTEYYLIEGNHDKRPLDFISKHPVVQTRIELEYNLPDWITYYPFWTQGKILQIGKARFLHGLYTNKNHGKTHLDDYEGNLFYGHTHDHMVTPQIRHGDNSTRTAMSCGCLCLYDQKYNTGKPNKWQQAFVDLQMWSNGNFNAFPVLLFNHCFVGPDGEFYDWK